MKPEYPIPVNLLDVPVHPVGYQDVTELVRSWIESRRQPSAYIVQTNVLSLVTAHNNSLYQETLETANLSVPDGMPLVWMLRRRGKVLTDRVYGPELMLRLCRIAEKEGWRCALLGGKPDVLEHLRHRLSDWYPNLQFVFSYSPPFRELTVEEDSAMCDSINLARPDILWIGLGSPKQDIWMFEHRRKLTVPALHGVGAAFDFHAGYVRQAPRWIMDAGLEWLFRLSREPGRLWRRYTVVNLLFVWYVILAYVKEKWRRRSQKVSGQ